MRDTVQSVIAQSYSNWELIIVDDCSTDNSIAIVRKEFKDARLVIVENKENKGANFCRNAGIQLSKGSYVLFLDADDALTAQCLEGRVGAALAHPDANLLVFSMGVFYKAIGDDARRWDPVSQQPLEDFLQHKLPWSILQPFWKKELLVELNGFDESFQRLQDVELNTRALLNANTRFKCMPGKVDCYYRIDETRKNFEPAVFFRRWIMAAVAYCDKFYTQVPVSKRKYLLGTIYQTYLALLLAYKKKQISAETFSELEALLLKQQLVQQSNFAKKALLQLAKKYNLLPVRIPGFNWGITRLLTF